MGGGGMRREPRRTPLRLSIVSLLQNLHPLNLYFFNIILTCFSSFTLQQHVTILYLSTPSYIPSLFFFLFFFLLLVHEGGGGLETLTLSLNRILCYIPAPTVLCSPAAAAAAAAIRRESYFSLEFTHNNKYIFFKNKIKIFKKTRKETKDEVFLLLLGRENESFVLLTPTPPSPLGRCCSSPN